MVNYNVQSLRYASPEMNYIFSEKGKTLEERNLWIEVMKAQKDMGVNIPDGVIEVYEAAKNNIDLGLIKEIELYNRHDIKAKIEAFNIEAAKIEIDTSLVKEIEAKYVGNIRGKIDAYRGATGGKFQHVHRAMTSKDDSDNLDQMLIKGAAELALGKYVSVLRHMADKAEEYESIFLTSRTHHQAAQPTLLGRRFSMWGNELHEHWMDLKRFIDDYPLRGIKGPVGTKYDMINLLGSKEKADELERRVAKSLGFTRILDNTGQVYYRSLDASLASKLSECAMACENFANGMRLMAGYELVTEGFKEGQVGSSIMPHKMNTRTSERIWGFGKLMKMWEDGASRIGGEQWEEGDVSDSVVRRVIIPNMFYSTDGLCEATLTVLNEMGPYPKVISKEVDKYLPFLATTEILGQATKKGMGREEAHKIIKKHAIAEALKMRNEGTYENNLVANLGNDSDFPLDTSEIQKILNEREKFIGAARDQIYTFVGKVDGLVKKYPEQAAYEPRPIL